MITEEKDNILNGVVLAGGKSSRMGQDKSEIKWHGTVQRNYLANLLSNHCEKVFISCREGQDFYDNNFPLIEDAFPDAGPIGAILSAFKKEPNATWLIIACDLPLLDNETLQQLIANRNPQSIATAFVSPHDGLPEPLIAIWEPSSQPILQQFLEKGLKCPRKVLLQSENVTLVEPLNKTALMNANTPEDAVLVRDILSKQFS